MCWKYALSGPFVFSRYGVRASPLCVRWCESMERLSTEEISDLASQRPQRAGKLGEDFLFKNSRASLAVPKSFSESFSKAKERSLSSLK